MKASDVPKKTTFAISRAIPRRIFIIPEVSAAIEVDLEGENKIIVIDLTNLKIEIIDANKEVKLVESREALHVIEAQLS